MRNRTATTVSEQRINFRLRSEDKELFAKAASVKGWTLTHLAKQSMRRYAKKIVMPKRLSDRDRDRFLTALDQFDQPNDALRAAHALYVASRPQ